MLFKTLSAAVFGIDAYIVDVEVDLTPKAGDGMAASFTLSLHSALSGYVTR